MSAYYSLTDDGSMPYVIREDKRFRVVRAYANEGGFYYKGQTRMGWWPFWVTRVERRHSEAAWAALDSYWSDHVLRELFKHTRNPEKAWIEHLFGKTK